MPQSCSEPHQKAPRWTGRGAAIAGLAMLAGCISVSPAVERGPAAAAAIGTAQPGAGVGEYRIGIADQLNVQVLYEPDISNGALKVENDGTFQFPFIGRVAAAGMTTGELSAQLRRGLLRYYKDPRVVVTVANAARQVVTIEGDVEAPGVYPVAGSTSLLQTVALAKGPRRTAKLTEVLVFRNVQGQRMGAVFDLQRIRYGYEPDPLILGGDTIVIGYNELKGAYRDFLSAAPLSGTFKAY
jgi:polysaccharide export outer membrane protein